jgi:uncharacterized repeat protein (TIGR03803 family)
MTNRPETSRTSWYSSFRLLAFAPSLLCVLTIITMQSAQAQTYRVIYNFTGGAGGSVPVAGLTMDRAGNIYGTTADGGPSGYGDVFKLTRKGSGWVFSSLHDFTGRSDGCRPFSGLIGAGNLYGTTAYGGTPGCPDNGGPGNGVVFKLSPPPCLTALCPWKETVLYDFAGGSDGKLPDGFGGGALVFDQAGNLYGTTANGGGTGCDYGCGTVYELSRSGSGWTESVLYRFTGGSDGAVPTSTLVFDQAGNLYGTAAVGGLSGCNFSVYRGCGTVFKLLPSGSGWTESVLYSFTGASDGGLPAGGLIFGPTGDLYGTTVEGGAGGGGTVFHLTPLNGNWTLETLHSFSGTGGSSAALAMDGAGNLYGTTGGDGVYEQGNVFKLAPSGGGWTYTSLHDFCSEPRCTDGAASQSNVIFDSNGNLYGTALYGGAITNSEFFNNGVVWEITP